MTGPSSILISNLSNIFIQSLTFFSLKKQMSIVPGSGLCACGLKGLEASCKLIFCVPNLRDFRFTLSVVDENSCNYIPKIFE